MYAICPLDRPTAHCWPPLTRAILVAVSSNARLVTPLRTITSRRCHVATPPAWASSLQTDTHYERLTHLPSVLSEENAMECGFCFARLTTTPCSTTTWMTGPVCTLDSSGPQSCKRLSSTECCSQKLSSTLESSCPRVARR